MAELETEQAQAGGEAIAIDDFQSLLNQEFKPKSERAGSAVSSAVNTLAEEILKREGGIVQDDAIATINAIIAEIDEKTTIYPNPTKGKITIHGFNDSRQFFLYNLSGQLLKNGEIIAGQISIDEFTNGMYYLTIEDGKSWLIIKE